MGRKILFAALLGGPGRDSLDGRGGNDVILDDAGVDEFAGAAGDDGHLRPRLRARAAEPAVRVGRHLLRVWR